MEANRWLIQDRIGRRALGVVACLPGLSLVGGACGGITGYNTFGQQAMATLFPELVALAGAALAAAITWAGYLTARVRGGLVPLRTMICFSLYTFLCSVAASTLLIFAVSLFMYLAQRNGEM